MEYTLDQFMALIIHLDYYNNYLDTHHEHDQNLFSYNLQNSNISQCTGHSAKKTG